MVSNILQFSGELVSWGFSGVMGFEEKLTMEKKKKKDKKRRESCMNERMKGN